jgi:hypothetical protein
MGMQNVLVLNDEVIDLSAAPFFLSGSGYSVYFG